jgi:carboxyl-terminal processing protease
MQTDPDLKALMGDAQAVEKLRQEKTVSLNLSARKAERERLDAERLARINLRRAAHGEAALKTLEDLKIEDEPDANLGETAEIVTDLDQALRLAPTRLSQVQGRKK